MDLDAKMAQLKKNYVEQLPVKIDAIIDVWRKLSDHDIEENRYTLYRLVHSLAGSGATYGFPTLTESARKLEGLIKAEDSAEISELPLRDLESAVSELARVAKEIAVKPN